MVNYKCSKCGLGVIILPNQEPIKACKCNATILADIKAHATGHGGFSKLKEWVDSKQ
jgi:DNA-directed RNA polymerase subunit RPC12/RpoP